jgi:general stress protein YciG
MNAKMEKSKRGFALLSPERRRELGAMGGRAATEAGTSHRYTRAEAREAGRKGGLATAEKRRASSSPASEEHGTQLQD